MRPAQVPLFGISVAKASASPGTVPWLRMNIALGGSLPGAGTRDRRGTGFLYDSVYDPERGFPEKVQQYQLLGKTRAGGIFTIRRGQGGSQPLQDARGHAGSASADGSRRSRLSPACRPPGRGTRG